MGIGLISLVSHGTRGWRYSRLDGVRLLVSLLAEYAHQKEGTTLISFLCILSARAAWQ